MPVILAPMEDTPKSLRNPHSKPPSSPHLSRGLQSPQEAEAQRNRDSSPENQEPFGDGPSGDPAGWGVSASAPRDPEGMIQGQSKLVGNCLDCRFHRGTSLLFVFFFLFIF